MQLTCNCMLLVFVTFNYSIAKSPLRVYGGNDADPDEYPYVVRLERQINVQTDNSTIKIIQHNHFCTASAIAVTWVLTAAHCLDGLDLLNAKSVIRYGHVLHSPWTKDTFSDIVLVIIHPLFAKRIQGLGRAAIRNDIGLIKATPMKIRTFMKLSAVDYLTFYGHEAIVAGFGITSRTIADGTVVTNCTLNLQLPLQVLDVLVNKCSSEVHKSLVPGICLSPRCGFTQIACPGDSGGPLIHPSGQIGVMSIGEWSSVCLSPVKKRPTFTVGIVLPISPYIEWINSYVNLDAV